MCMNFNSTYSTTGNFQVPEEFLDSINEATDVAVKTFCENFSAEQLLQIAIKYYRDKDLEVGDLEYDTLIVLFVKDFCLMMSNIFIKTHLSKVHGIHPEFTDDERSVLPAIYNIIKLLEEIPERLGAA